VEWTWYPYINLSLDFIIIVHTLALSVKTLYKNILCIKQFKWALSSKVFLEALGVTSPTSKHHCTSRARRFNSPTPLQDLTHLLLDCPASEPLRPVIFGTTSSIFDLWSRPWTWPECWVSVEFLHVLIPRKGSGSTTTFKFPFAAVFADILRANKKLIAFCFQMSRVRNVCFWFLKWISRSWQLIKLGFVSYSECFFCFTGLSSSQFQRMIESKAAPAMRQHNLGLMAHPSAIIASRAVESRPSLFFLDDLSCAGSVQSSVKSDLQENQPLLELLRQVNVFRLSSAYFISIQLPRVICYILLYK